MSRKKTHCIRGHEFKEGSFHVAPNGARVCLACVKIRKKNPAYKKRQVACIKKWQKRNPNWHLRSRVKKYGISIEDYDDMFREQNGVCAICQKPEREKRMAIDHDHDTGVVRGLLCSACNMGLGCFSDDPRIIDYAMRYLWIHKPRCIKYGVNDNNT